MSTYLDNLSSLNEDTFDYHVASKDLASMIQVVDIDLSQITPAHQVSDEFDLEIEELDAHNGILSCTMEAFSSATIGSMTLYGAPGSDDYGHYASEETSEFDTDADVEIIHHITFEYSVQDKKFNVSGYWYHIDSITLTDSSLYDSPDADAMVDDAQSFVLSELDGISESDVKIIKR